MFLLWKRTFDRLHGPYAQNAGPELKRKSQEARHMVELGAELAVVESVDLWTLEEGCAPLDWRYSNPRPN